LNTQKSDGKRYTEGKVINENPERKNVRRKASKASQIVQGGLGGRS